MSLSVHPVCHPGMYSWPLTSVGMPYPSHRNSKHPLVNSLGTLPHITTCDEISYVFLSWEPYTYLYTGHKKCFHGTSLYLLTSFISLYLLLKSAEKLKKCEIEMRPNQAYETVSGPRPSKSATQIHTERCIAYADVVVQACN